MSYLINNQQKLNDIIFADRNKAYGAYALRSNYGNTLLKSISFMVLGVGLMMSAAVFMSNKNKPDENLGGQVFITDSVYVIKFNQEEKEEPAEPEEKKLTKKEKLEKTENIDYTKIDSTYEATTTPTLNLASSAGTLTSSDDGVTEPDNGTIKIRKGGGSGGPDTALAINESFEVDTEPQFEGGLKALYKFISHHLKYPNWASSEGKEGTVFVKFVVDENGKVGRLSLLNTVGYGMDDEAVRVVSLIPKFKSPAKVKGQPVKAYYQLPIRFTFSKY